MVSSPMRTQYGSSSPSTVRAPSGLKFELPSFSFGSESIVAGTSIPEPERTPTPQPPPKTESNTPVPPTTGTQTPDPLRAHPTTSRGDLTPKGSMAPPISSNSGAGPSSNGQSSTTISSGMSPPLKRPNHVRRLLSLRSLSASFSSHGRSDSQMSGMSDASTANSDFHGPSSRSQTPSVFGRKSTSLGYERPGTSGGQSTTPSNATGKPSLRKRVSGAFWNRRSSFLISNIEESGEEREIGHTPGSGGKENRGPAAKRQKPTAPAPLLPEIGDLRVSKGLKENDGGFLNSQDLFSKVKYKREVSAEEMETMKRQKRMA